MSGTPKNEHDNENPTLENNVVGIRNNNTIQKKKIKKDKTTNKKHGSLFVAKVIKEKKYLVAIFVGLVIGLCCLLITLAITLINKQLEEPTLTLDGVEELIDSSNGNNPIIVTGDLTTNCQLVSSLGEDLHPVRENSSLEESTIEDNTYSKYTEYGAAWCDVVLNGQYTADASLEVDLISDNKDYKITEFDNGKLQIIKRYKIYADLVGQPDGAAQNIKFTMTGKKGDDENSTSSVILIYDLNIATLLSDTDKSFFSDWSNKIDERTAQEIAEEERKKEEARLAEEQKQHEYENVVDTAVSPAYSDLLGNAENYRGKYIKITGRILEINSSNTPPSCRIGTKKGKRYASTGVSYGYYVDDDYYSANDVVYVENCNLQRGEYLENDVISVVGIGRGTKVYTNAFDDNIEIPLISGQYFWIVKNTGKKNDG